MSRLNSRHLVSLAVASALAAAAMNAQAQSTATQIEEELEEVVVTATTVRVSGLIQAEEAPKGRTTVSGEYLTTQAAGQSVLNSLNLVPGVNFTNDDAYGGSGGRIRMRSFDDSRISMMVDGVQLNDSGNYAVYSSQMIDSELLERASVNLGTTDVDSPTASATGGTVNLVMARPKSAPQLLVQPSIGGDDFRRIFVRADSGAFGPWGTTALVAFSDQQNDKFIGTGKIKRTQYNARLFQDLGDGDFASISANYNTGRNHFIRNISIANFRLRNFSSALNQTSCTQQTPTAGTTQTAVACSSYYNLSNNPSNTGNVRGQLSLGVTDKLRFTFDPSFQYVLANGGSSTTIDEDRDARLLGATGIAGVNGVDLNGDGDILDTVLVYRPNNTNTKRYGVNSALIYSLSDVSRLRLSYTLDRAWHRQTGQMGYVDANGDPQSVFAGRGGDPIPTYDGNELRRRDRKSIALLNQVSLSYTTRFAEDRGNVSLGVRAPFFKRDLNQYCYTLAVASGGDTPGGDPFCTTQAPIATNPTTGFVTLTGRPGNGNVPVTGTNNNQYQLPYSRTVKYDKLLPNVGVSFKPWDDNQFYASYSKGLSAPRTDVLYNLEIPGVGPEETDNFELGWRYDTGSIVASSALWKTDYKNRIVQAYDEELAQSTDRNVGAVDLWGFDTAIGFEPVQGLMLYATGSYINSEVQDNLPLSATNFAPTAGKELVETPKYTVGGRIEYSIAGFTAGVQGKYVGARWATDVNDLESPSYAVFDANLRYEFGFRSHTSFVQLNVINLLDREYLGKLSTTTSNPAGNSAFGQLGAPRTFQVTWQMLFKGD